MDFIFLKIDSPSSYLEVAIDPNIPPAKSWHNSKTCEFKSC